MCDRFNQVKETTRLMCSYTTAGAQYIAEVGFMSPFAHHPAAFINDPDHWRARADYMRGVADIVDEPETKNRMLRIAADYEALAESAEEHLLNDIVVANQSCAWSA